MSNQILEDFTSNVDKVKRQTMHTKKLEKITECPDCSDPTCDQGSV